VVSLQFKAFANPYPKSAEGSPYLVVLQSDLLSQYHSVVVAPLQPLSSAARASVFRPYFEIDGHRYVLNILEVPPMPRRDLGRPVTELDRFRVISAYDGLISGALL
jgi:hypothetical protein